MIEQLTFITGNLAKAEQLSRYLVVPLKHKALDLEEIQSLNLEEIVVAKVKAAYDKLRSPVLVEDVSLTFNALGALPGPLIKWFLKELGNEGLCKLLDQHVDRSAVAEVLYGLYDGQALKTFSGRVEGVIADSPRGNTHFGWDPIFIPNGSQKSWAEMSKEEHAETAMRKIALEKLADYLINS